MEKKPHPGVESIFNDIDSYQLNFSMQLNCKYENIFSLETRESLKTCENYSERFFKGYIEEFKTYLPGFWPKLEEAMKQNRRVENGTCPTVLMAHCELEPFVRLVRTLTQYFSVCRDVYKNLAGYEYHYDRAKIFLLMILPVAAFYLRRISYICSIMMLAISSLLIVSRIVSSTTPYIMKLVFLLLANGKEPFQWLV